MPVMCIVMEEQKYAFRVNGVTFSKKKLAEFFPRWEADTQTFWRYLAMMPFFAETKEPEEAPTKVGFYAIYKAKRLQKALGVYDEAIVAFMIMAAQIGNVDQGKFNLIADECHDHVCNCGVKNAARDFGGKTLH